MKKTLVEIYALLVCFASIFIVIVNAATGLYSAVRATQPTITVDGYAYRRSLSDEDFMQAWPQQSAKPHPADVPALRKAAYAQALDIESRGGLNVFISSFMYVVAAGLVFGLHWRLAQRENATLAASAFSRPCGEV